MWGNDFTSNCIDFCIQLDSPLHALILKLDKLGLLAPIITITLQASHTILPTLGEPMLVNDEFPLLCFYRLLSRAMQMRLVLDLATSKKKDTGSSNAHLHSLLRGNETSCSCIACCCGYLAWNLCGEIRAKIIFRIYCFDIAAVSTTRFYLGFKTWSIINSSSDWGKNPWISKTVDMKNIFFTTVVTVVNEFRPNQVVDYQIAI